MVHNFDLNMENKTTIEHWPKVQLTSHRLNDDIAFKVFHIVRFNLLPSKSQLPYDSIGLDAIPLALYKMETSFSYKLLKHNNSIMFLNHHLLIYMNSDINRIPLIHLIKEEGRNKIKQIVLHGAENWKKTIQQRSNKPIWLNRKHSKLANTTKFHPYLIQLKKC